MSVKEWLKSEQDYFKGVDLYEQHGDNSTLKTLFRIRKTSFSEKKLLESLQAIAGKEEPKPEEKEKFPPKVLELIRKRSVLHNNLVHTNPTAVSNRYEIAKSIIAITKKLDRWYQNGELPEEDQPDPVQQLPTNGWELHALFGNNRSYITKNKKAEDKQAEVQKREQENGLIEARLKEMEYGAIQK